MNPLRLLSAALTLGLLGDLLFHEAGLGLNLFIWTTVLGLEWMYLRRARESGPGPTETWLWTLLAFFSLAVAWRASAVLVFLNFTAMLAAAGLIPLAREAPGRLRSMRVPDAISAAMHSGLSLALGLAPTVLRAGDSRLHADSGRNRAILAAGRGLLLAIPLVLVFGSLFDSADEGFHHIASRLLQFDLSEVVSHLFLVGAFAWVAAGFFAAASTPVGDRLPASLPQARPFLGAIEVGVILGALDLLFLSFVALQLGYLFGGAEVVRAVAGLTYAEYARRGFFELVTVAALVLPLLLTGSALLRRGDPHVERVFRWGAGLLIALVFVVMGSAMHRMILYEREFGLTEQRFYASGFMGWLGVVLGWFVATVLRGRPVRFLVGALAAWAVGIGLLDAINPEAMIVRTNVEHAEAGHGMDTAYAAGLSADAVPALVASLPRLEPTARRAVAARLIACWSPRDKAGWRDWSLGRSRALAAVEENVAMVQGAAETTAVAGCVHRRD